MWLKLPEYWQRGESVSGAVVGTAQLGDALDTLNRFVDERPDDGFLRVAFRYSAATWGG